MLRTRDVCVDLVPGSARTTSSQSEDAEHKLLRDTLLSGNEQDPKFEPELQAIRRKATTFWPAIDRDEEMISQL